MSSLQRLFDRVLAVKVFVYDSLREDRFFLVSYVVGSYLVFQTVYNDLTGRYPLCSTGPGCSFPSGSVFVFGILLLVLATCKREADVEGRSGERSDHLE